METRINVAACHTCKGSGRSERAVRMVRALCGNCHGTGKEPDRIYVRTSRGVESRPNPRASYAKGPL